MQNEILEMPAHAKLKDNYYFLSMILQLKYLDTTYLCDVYLSYVSHTTSYTTSIMMQLYPPAIDITITSK